MGGLIFNLIQNLISRLSVSDTLKCNKCKTKMTMTNNYLYLLPISFDTKHEESAQYYIENGKLINDVNNIPAGRRAFYLNCYQCPSCGERKASTVDFLQVHDNCVIEGGNIYPYESFSNFITNSQMNI